MFIIIIIALQANIFNLFIAKEFQYLLKSGRSGDVARPTHASISLIYLSRIEKLRGVGNAAFCLKLKYDIL